MFYKILIRNSLCLFNIHIYVCILNIYLCSFVHFFFFFYYHTIEKTNNAFIKYKCVLFGWLLWMICVENWYLKIEDIIFHINYKMNEHKPISPLGFSLLCVVWYCSNSNNNNNNNNSSSNICVVHLQRNITKLPIFMMMILVVRCCCLLCFCCFGE